MNDFLQNQLIKKFEGCNTFRKSEVDAFYRQYEPEIKASTLAWRIYDLKQKNIITSLGKGIYTLSSKFQYLPNLGDLLKRTAKLLARNFSDLNYCIWEISWLNEFANHQVNANFILLDVEKELLSSVFFNLKDHNQKNLFLEPDEDEIKIYVLENENSIILNRLVSRAPRQKIANQKFPIYVPRLEKILTDIYCDRDIFYFYSNSELEYIFENALSRYTLDFSRLFAYAKRRGKEAELKEFIEEKVNYLIPDFTNIQND